MSNDVLVIIPAYNEEKTIASVLVSLRQAAPEFDCVVINDGSKDSTGKIVEDLGIKQMSHPCNLGYGQSLQTGLKYALMRGYNTVVTFDADGQHRPEDVPKLVEALHKRELDLVIGSRFCDNRPYTGPLGRKLGQLLFSQLTRILTGRRIYDTTSGFKALRSPACEVLVKGTFLDIHTEALVKLCLMGFKISEIPINVIERTSGQSMYSFISSFEYPLKTLLLIAVSIIDAVLMRRTK